VPVTATKTAFVRVRAALHESATLATNSGALAIGAVATAGLGFVYWWLAARIFPPEMIGNASALLSVVGLVGLLGEAGLGTLLVGEIIRHPGKAPSLVAAAASVGVALAIGLALSFVLGAHFLGAANLIDGWLAGTVFVVGCGLTALTMVVDQAFVGSLNSTGRMIQQVLFSMFKLMLLALVPIISQTSSTVILLTWVAGLLASWIGADLVTRGGARRLIGIPDFRLLHTFKRTVFDHYALDVTLQAPGIIVPYLVLVLLSSATTAAFSVLWMLVSTAAVIPAVLATVLFPVVRAGPNKSRHHFLVSLTASLLFSLACAVFIFLYSQEILAIFNPAYREIAGSDLRLLGFSLLGSTLKFHACAMARLVDAMRKASLPFALGGLLELGFVVAGAKIGGLEGLVVGWTIAVSIEGICVCLIWVFAANLGISTNLSHKFAAAPPLQI
jgi:O-antigen/teichoic acid export membrane protein